MYRAEGSYGQLWRTSRELGRGLRVRGNAEPVDRFFVGRFQHTGTDRTNGGRLEVNIVFHTPPDGRELSKPA